MKKFLHSENFYFCLIFCLNLALLIYAISKLSISFYEAEIYFNSSGVVGFLANLSCEIFSQNDYALRLPFLLIHLTNSILIYKISKILLKRKIDRLVSAAFYMFLPGVMTSAIVVNPAGISILFTLLFIYFYLNEKVKISLGILIFTIFIDISFIVLYLGVFFYAIYKKKKILALVSGTLLVLSLMFYDYEVGGKPKGYLLEAVGVYAASFSPLIFLFFVYAIYRIWIKEEKTFLWFIVITAFLSSILLSFRQRVELELFLPFVVIGIPLLVRVFFYSYRVRLPKFRRNYSYLAIFLSLTLLLSSLFVVNNHIFYPLFFKDEPKRHFMYKFDIAKELSEKLKKDGIESVLTFDEELALRLKFYSINAGGRYILSEEPVTKNAKSIEIYRFKILVAKYYLN